LSAGIVSLGPRDAGVRLAIGVSGAGKSYGIIRDVHRAARAGMRVVVVDSMHEWVSVPSDLAARTRRVPDVAAAVAAFNDKGTRIAIVTPHDSTAATEDACRWALETSELRGVVVHEAWMVAPSKATLTPGLQMVTRAWRHKHVAAWLDTQRVAALSRHVTDLARETRLYAVTGDRDFAVVREIGGNELETAVRACAAKLASGAPGWHVELGANRLGPFVPKRST
jgi:hypothetical protein